MTRSQSKVSEYLCLTTAFLLPLKLAAAYAVVIPGILYWLYTKRRSLSFKPEPVFIPWLIFLAIFLTSSLFGLSPVRSFQSLSALFFYSLAIPWFADAAPVKKTLLVLLAGQTLASLETCFQALLPFKSIFLGSVTEAQQLALTVPLALALFFESERENDKKNYFTRLILSFFLVIALVHTGLGANYAPETILYSGITVIIILALVLLFRSKFSSLEFLFFPILLSALVVGLKRGPWLGVFFSLLYLVFSCRKRLTLILLGLFVTCTVLLPPVLNRVNDSYKDFTIPGGRSVIWTIGGELLTEFPLGIGFSNAKVLREFSKEIPPELTHFHSNFINITVEGGWLTLAAYLSFLASLFRYGTLRSSENPFIRRGLVAALISWQIAGIGEYNIGDSEVLLIAFLCIGLLGSSDFKDHNMQAPKKELKSS